MITNAFQGRCEADRQCRRAPCFEAQLEAQSGVLPIRRNAALCADHLGDMVQSLAAWARREGVTHGTVTVLAVDPTCPLHAADQAIPRGLSRAFEFGAIPLA
jgi:hypothetical protein